jgi:hypothetical protein
MFRRRKGPEPGADSDGNTVDKHDRRKKSKFYERFAQQDLRGWSPIITGNVVVVYFFIIAVVCLALGIPILKAQLGVHQYVVRYDNTGPMAGLSSEDSQNVLLQQNGQGVVTTVNITVTQTLNPPVRCEHSFHKPFLSIVWHAGTWLV